MTDAEKLQAAERAWLDLSHEEDFFFSAFSEPKRLRRSVKCPGALADLTFGKYQALDHEWVSDERAVWLGMIVSNKPGSGGQLLDMLTRSFAKLGLFVIGTPTPMKPRDWDDGRSFDWKPENLICWYIRHKFRVVQSGFDTRVIYSPMSSKLEASFKLK